MAVDCYQMFIKGGGVYSSLESITFGAKLKLLFECFPIAFLIEAAQGVATNGENNILDIIITGFE